MTSTTGAGVTGPARNAVWDTVLIHLSDHGQVVPQEVAAAVDVDITEDEVRQVLDSLADKHWLARPRPAADIWLPDERAERLLKLPLRVTRVSCEARLGSTESQALSRQLA